MSWVWQVDGVVQWWTISYPRQRRGRVAIPGRGRWHAPRTRSSPRRRMSGSSSARRSRATGGRFARPDACQLTTAAALPVSFVVLDPDLVRTCSQRCRRRCRSRTPDPSTGRSAGSRRRRAGCRHPHRAEKVSSPPGSRTPRPRRPRSCRCRPRCRGSHCPTGSSPRGRNDRVWAAPLSVTLLKYCAVERPGRAAHRARVRDPVDRAAVEIDVE